MCVASTVRASERVPSAIAFLYMSNEATCEVYNLEKVFSNLNKSFFILSYHLKLAAS